MEEKTKKALARSAPPGSKAHSVYRRFGRGVIDSTTLSGILAIPHEVLLKRAEGEGLEIDKRYACHVAHYTAEAVRHMRPPGDALVAQLVAMLNAA